MRAPPFRRSNREPSLGLINIVFLMLIFFLVAGHIAPRPDARLTLVRADAMQAAPPDDAVLVLPDGTLLRAGASIGLQDAAASGAVRLMPDRALPAEALVALARDLAAAGATSVILVAERSAP